MSDEDGDPRDGSDGVEEPAVESGSIDPPDDTADHESDSVAPGRASDAGRDDRFDDLGFPDDEPPEVDDSLGETAWDGEAGDLGEAFERMDVGGPAEEDVWESLDADIGIGGAASVGGGDTEHVVLKRTYCQQCPHFTQPPEVACTHEGTSIVEAVGFDEFRVRNCPMISEENPRFGADR